MATKLCSVTSGCVSWEVIVLMPAEQVSLLVCSVCPYGCHITVPVWSRQLRCKVGRYLSTYGCFRGEQSVISHLIELNIELLDSEKPDSVCFWLISQFFSPSFMSGSQSPVLLSSKLALFLPAERVSVGWGCREWGCAFKRGWQKIGICGLRCTSTSCKYWKFVVWFLVTPTHSQGSVL